MQDYYYVPGDDLILEVGRDEWIYNPRENVAMNNLFHFWTWEDDGSPSPDQNEYENMEEMYAKMLGKSDQYNMVKLEIAMRDVDYVIFPVCKDEWGYLYELKTDDHTRPVVGYLFQKANILKENCRSRWQGKAEQELKYYNQYINRDVFFINSYRNGEVLSYKNGIYEKDRELSYYDGYRSLGCYDCIQECMRNNPNPSGSEGDVIERYPKKKHKQSTLSKIFAQEKMG